MSDKDYIRIPETQLRFERERRITDRIWHRNVMNLLSGKNVCGCCLRSEEDLVHWDAEFVWMRREYDFQLSLKNVMLSTFGPDVINIVPSVNFCNKCVDIMLSAHLLIFELRKNSDHIQRKLTEISRQLKWTEYLDETGALLETLNNKINLNDDSETPNDDLSRDKTENIKTHKIVLNNESLKTALLKEPSMHKFLFTKEKLRKPKLPRGIKIRKVTTSMDMSEFAPQDLLELNWAEVNDDPVSIIPEKQVSNDKLLSNETLIMNLMEQAKTVEKQIHFQENLQLQAKNLVPEQNLNDSLSVNLIQTNVAKESSSDNEDLVPQDLLELKWPEDQSNNKTHHTKIPVKKLNFNEALTVKYIPSHKVRRVAENVDHLAPHELLELSWDDKAKETTEPHTNQKDQNRNIDLTQWLHDQGMSTIKTKVFTHKNKIISSITAVDLASKRSKSQNNSNKEITDSILNENPPAGTAQDTKKGDTLEDLLNCNIIVRNSVKATELDSNAIRCGHCHLSFIQFESYWSHYKTHSTAETAKCYRCPAKFPVIELLVEHLLLMHSEDMAYCTLCYALLSQGRVAKHMIDYHAKKVEVINAGLRPNEYCSKCKRAIANPDQPHICGMLECTQCEQHCVHQKYLKSYRDQIKANVDVLKCTDCDYQYKSVQNMISHVNSTHLHHKAYPCKFCNAKFSLQLHLTNHNDSYHFRCRGCKESFGDRITLDAHNCPKTFAIASNLKCEFCNEQFIALKSYVQHKQTSFAATQECVICKCKVTSKCNMARHVLQLHNLYLRTEREGVVFECTKCVSKFTKCKDFKQHVCLFQCRICTKTFGTKKLYEKHLETHFGVKECFDCCICGLRFSDKNALENHMPTHKEYKICPVCLAYIDKRIFRRHKDSHDNQKETLKCPHCPLICENQNQYEVHVNRFHLLSRPYECDICKKRFYSKLKLREHIKLHASEPRTQKCIICSKKFARKATLQKHMKLHFTGQLYDCDVCKKKYISAALLAEHQKSHINNSNSPVPKTSQDSD